MALKPAAALPPAPTFNVVLIGPPKTGKTTAAASAPGPVLYVNTDLATGTRFARRRFGDEHVREVEFEGMQTLIDVTHEVNNPDGEYKTVVIDTMGDLYTRLLEEASADDKGRPALKPSLPVYGDVTTHVRRFAKAMCMAPVNAVFVCHDLPVDEGEEREVLPFMGTTGKGGVALGRKLLALVDVIAYTGVHHSEGERHYLGQLTPNKGRPGGDRFNCLAGDNGLRELDLTEWRDAIQASENPTNDEKENKA